jgi:hypothetical protein
VHLEWYSPHSKGGVKPMFNMATTGTQRCIS